MGAKKLSAGANGKPRYYQQAPMGANILSARTNGEPGYYE